MKAIRLDQPQQFARIDIPEPPAPAAGEAVVRVHRIGIKGPPSNGASVITSSVVSGSEHGIPGGANPHPISEEEARLAVVDWIADAIVDRFAVVHLDVWAISHRIRAVRNREPPCLMQ